MICWFSKKGRIYFCLMVIAFPILASQKPLTLDIVLSSVKHHYPTLISRQIDIAKSMGDYLSAKGAFDPRLSITTRQLPEGGYVSHAIDNEISLPTTVNGLRLFGGYRVGRGDYPSYYQNYLTNSQGEYRIGFELPLLKDRMIDTPRANLMIQRQMIALAKTNQDAEKIAIFQGAIRTYWTWVGAGLQMKVVKSLLSLAKVRQVAIERQAHQGDLALLAIAENKQQILQRQQMLNDTQFILDKSAIELSLYYRDSHGRPIRPSPMQLPLSLHSSNDHSPLPTLQKALRNHPLLKQYDYQIANNATRLNLAKNEKLPTLNALVYTTKQDGNDGDPRLLDNALFMGIRFYFPLLQREARGKIQAEKANFFKLINERRFTRDKLNQSYQLLKRELIFTKQQLALIQNELVLAERVQYGEDQKFKAGDSSLFLVNQREQAVAQIAFNLIKMQLNEKQVKTTLQYFNGVD